jgi:hypothetical protein
LLDLIFCNIHLVDKRTRLWVFFSFSFCGGWRRGGLVVPSNRERERERGPSPFFLSFAVSVLISISKLLKPDVTFTLSLSCSLRFFLQICSWCKREIWRPILNSPRSPPLERFPISFLMAFLHISSWLLGCWEKLNGMIP